MGFCLEKGGRKKRGGEREREGKGREEKGGREGETETGQRRKKEEDREE